MTSIEKKNKYYFGLGTIGRDMFYSFEANTLIYFLSNILSLPVQIFASVSLLLSILRVADAINDPITGMVVDNIRSPYGKFKPAIAIGGLISSVFFVLLFADIGKGALFVVIFALCYILWDITYGVNDIAYWTMLPSLTTDQKKRENIGAFARICANIGAYIVMVGWQPITSAMGNTKRDWLIVAIVIAVLYLVFLIFPIFGVKQPHASTVNTEKTSVKDMMRAIFENDQLLWTTLAMSLFMIGYMTTTGFAAYYMQYLFGDISMYPILAAVGGVSQLAALAIFPIFSKRLNRRQLYTAATVLIFAGYILFAFAERSLLLIAVSAVAIFAAQAFIQLLMLMFLADTVEYGQWKIGKRSESVTFSIQPMVNKVGGAISTFLISGSLILSGIKKGDVAAESITNEGKLIVKAAMFAVPLLCIAAGYLIYMFKFKLNEKLYKNIVDELKEKGEL